jgi:hypothetical protein
MRSSLLKPGQPLQRKTPLKRSSLKSSSAGLLRVAAVQAKAFPRGRESKRRKTRADYLADAQAAFNAFIRARDVGKPCASCDDPNPIAVDAGHYRSVGAQPALRFHEDNAHGQCIHCNRDLAGNAAAYRVRLIARIGLERVEFLEREHPPAKFTVEDAKRIKVEYTAKAKALKEAA